MNPIPAPNNSETDYEDDRKLSGNPEHENHPEWCNSEYENNPALYESYPVYGDSQYENNPDFSDPQYVNNSEYGNPRYENHPEYNTEYHSSYEYPAAAYNDYPDEYMSDTSSTVGKLI